MSESIKIEIFNCVSELLKSAAPAEEIGKLFEQLYAEHSES